ncbi:MAG: glycoside hydrolase family 3 C-terminal domain-containing protein [Akkermansiaceae bacterium]|nr:glycoside hydrolase family 3 C-terminal domain-containing protein [Akkermansiaceae bacterium]
MKMMKWNHPLRVLQLAVFGTAVAVAKTPTQDQNAGRNDEKSKQDQSRPLIYPVSFDDCKTRGVDVITRKDIYHDGWIDLNKNGKKDVYEDPTQAVEKRIDDLLGQMTVDEKTAQMVTLYGYNRVTPDYLPSKAWFKEVQKDGIGNIDEHLNGFNYYDNNKMPGNQFALDPERLVWALNETRRFFIEDTRLGVPCEFTNEGLRGTETAVSTGFPVPLAQASSWNRELIRGIAEVAGKETYALGYDSLYAPLIDVVRDPRWGRCEEMFAECPWLVGEYATLAVQAIQAQGVTSSPKHFAVYSSAMGARQGYSRTDPQSTPRMNEYIHLWPWRRVMRDAKPEGVMCSYNDYDGIPIAANHYFLTEILRKQMGFEGYVVSDSEAVEYLHQKHHVARDQKEAVRQTVLAGLNVRTTFRTPDTFIDPLRELVAEKALPMEVIDARVRDVLRVKFRRGLFDKPYRSIQTAGEVALADAHVALSRKASEQALILLKNEDRFLPLAEDRYQTIAVCGPNADSVEYARQHYGPLTNDTITVKRALEEYRKKDGTSFKVLYAQGCEFTDDRWPESEILPMAPNAGERRMLDAAVANAKQADLTVVVVGDTPYGSKARRTTCGENNSRTGLDLAGHQDLLVREIAATGKPFVVVHFSGRPNALNWPNAVAPAILHSFLPGPFGGAAAVDALFGKINPCGKTPVNFVKTTGQLPLAFPAKPAANAESERSVSGYLWPFGFGLSYTTFNYSNLKLSPPTIPVDGKCRVTFTVENTGDRAGAAIPQLYFQDVVSSVTVYETQLRDFARVELQPGEAKVVTLEIDAAEDLWLIDKDMNKVVEPGVFRILIGASSQDFRLKAKLLVK